MAWETRHHNKTYYYRARKVNGRVIKTYVGSGPLAEELAAEDEAAREAQHEERAARQAQRAALTAIDAPLEVFADAVEVLTRANLIDAGFHFHRSSEWRKRRHG